MLKGYFDFTPDEEVAPIWITDFLCFLYGDVPAPTKEGVVSLRLLKHMVFGTGGHPSTKAAIVAILNLSRSRVSGSMGIEEEKRPMPSPFLEIGDSNGSLALVAATAGAPQINHCSASLEAGALAEDNGCINGHEMRSDAVNVALSADDHFEGYGCIATQTGGAEWIQEVLPLFHGVLQPGGWLVYAGHTADQHQSIRCRLEEFFELKRVDDFAGWPVMIFQKDK